VEEVRKEHIQATKLALSEHASAMTVLKENHRKDVQQRENETVQLKEAFSTLESRHIEDTVRIKYLESRLVESLQARMAVVDDREGHIDSVVRSLNIALVQLQKGKAKDGSDEKQRLMTEIGSLTYASKRLVKDSVDEKVVSPEITKRDSAQPSPELDGQGPILERQGPPVGDRNWTDGRVGLQAR
jgi:hypothetical protein